MRQIIPLTLFLIVAAACGSAQTSTANPGVEPALSRDADEVVELPRETGEGSSSTVPTTSTGSEEQPADTPKPPTTTRPATAPAAEASNQAVVEISDGCEPFDPAVLGRRLNTPDLPQWAEEGWAVDVDGTSFLLLNLDGRRLSPSTNPPPGIESTGTRLTISATSGVLEAEQAWITYVPGTGQILLAASGKLNDGPSPEDC
jgi:hypothetical protein